jgi:CRP-like cAMP-binding protein
LEVHEILRSPQLLAEGIAERQTYAANQRLITEGDADRRLFLIESGLVRVTGRVTLEDNRHIQPGLCDLGPGDVFGELTLFDAAPRSASVVAVEDSEVLVFEAAMLADYFDCNPDRGYAVLKSLFSVLTTRLRQADQRLESLFAWGLKMHGIDKHL